MTKPIPLGAPRQRPARSCNACRSSKVKCFGAAHAEDEDVDSETLPLKPCDRCSRNLDKTFQCVFPALRRKGRPRRLPKDSKPGFDLTPQIEVLKERDAVNEELLELFGPSGVVATPGRDFVVASSVGKEEPPSPTQVKSEDDEKNPFSGSHMDLLLSYTPQHFQRDHGGISSSNSSYSSSGDNSTSPSSLGASPVSSSSFILAESGSKQLEDLAHGYLAEIHPWLAILPSSVPELVAHLATSSPTLTSALTAILSIGQPNAPLPPTEFGDSIADFQACLVAVATWYGLREQPRAWDVLLPLSRRMVEKGWHLVDSPASPVAPGDKEAVRLLFWEVWVLEAVLSVVTGVRSFVLQQIAFEVDTPAGFEEFGSPFMLRLRAASLMLTCAAPPAGGPPTPEYIESIVSLSTSLALLAEHSYTSLVTLTPIYSPPDPDVLRAREAAWMATVTANSAVFLALSSSFASVAFECGIDDTVSIAPERIPDVIGSVDRCLAVTLLSLNPAFVPPTHSPFFACSILATCLGTSLRLYLPHRDEEEQVGRVRQVQQHLGVMEAVLLYLQARWPIAGRSLGEVKRVQSMLPVV